MTTGHGQGDWGHTMTFERSWEHGQGAVRIGYTASESLLRLQLGCPPDLLRPRISTCTRAWHQTRAASLDLNLLDGQARRVQIVPTLPNEGCPTDETTVHYRPSLWKSDER